MCKFLLHPILASSTFARTGAVACEQPSHIPLAPLHLLSLQQPKLLFWNTNLTTSLPPTSPNPNLWGPHCLYGNAFPCPVRPHGTWPLLTWPASLMHASSLPLQPRQLSSLLHSVLSHLRPLPELYLLPGTPFPALILPFAVWLLLILHLFVQRAPPQGSPPWSEA